MKIHNKTIYVALFILIIGVALCLRLWDLGKFGFWQDEFFHVLAAKGIIETGQPIIPPERLYTRALPFTYSVAASFKLFGRDEWSARFPSVIFDIAFIIIGFLLVRSVFGLNVAFIFMLFLALSPLNIHFARGCRMYALFNLFFFTGVWFFFEGYEQNRDKHIIKGIPIINKMQISPTMLFLSCLAFGVAFILQPLAANFSFVLFFYAIIRFVIVTYDREERFSGVWYKYLLTLVGIPLLFMICYFVKKEYMIEFYTIARYGLGWDKYMTFSPHYYRWILTDYYGVMIYFLPFGIVCMIQKYKRRGLYFSIVFLTLVLLHSFLFRVKQERYFFYGISFYLLIPAVFASVIINRAMKSMKEKAMAIKAGLSLFILVFIFIITVPIALPAIDRAIKCTWGDYKAFYESIKDKIDRDAVFVSTEWEHFCYYFGKEPDYLWSFMESLDESVRNPKRIEDLNIIRKVLAHKKVYFVSRFDDLDDKRYFKPEVKKFLEENFKQLHFDRKLDINIYESIGQ
ncbi:MAG: glycosyltransferase family 39 protein [Candidatus Omnitrophica bacterium]|nr:glycosyltransferase family 39 protein [Candidatus Omnitrophota bacterium]